MIVEVVLTQLSTRVYVCVCVGVCVEVGNSQKNITIIKIFVHWSNTYIFQDQWEVTQNCCEN